MVSLLDNFFEFTLASRLGLVSARLTAKADRNSGRKDLIVCRNIKTLYNFTPPATDDEIQAAALQYVRKVSGFRKPSRANEAAFQAAVDEVALATGRLLKTLETGARPKNREEEAAKARARAAKRSARRS
jgi:hypothetical protein